MARKMPLTRSFGYNVSLTAFTNFLLMALALLTGSLSARLLGPRGRGELAAIQIWPSFIATIAMLGMPEAVVYFSGRNPAQAGRYLGSGVGLTLIMAVPFLLVGYWFMPVLLAAQTEKVIAAARWYLLLIPIYALIGMPHQVLRGRNELVIWNVLRILPPLAWLMVLIWATVLGQARPEFLATTYLIALALLFLPMIAVVVHRVPGPYWPQIRLWKPMLRYGLPSMVGAVPQILNLRLDQMLMAALLEPRSLGLYAAAVAWSTAINPLLNAVSAVLFPWVASISSEIEQAASLALGVRFGALLALGSGGILLVLTPLAMPLLYGVEFTPVVPAALVLVIAGAISGIRVILEEGVRGLRYPRIVMETEFAGLFVTVSLLALLLRPFQVMGAALASLVGYSVMVIYLLARVRSLTRLPITRVICPTRSDVTQIWRRFVRIRLPKMPVK
jgi:O-antigen/teichoic acid export membrane protein